MAHGTAMSARIRNASGRSLSSSLRFRTLLLSQYRAWRRSWCRGSRVRWLSADQADQAAVERQGQSRGGRHRRRRHPELEARARPVGRVALLPTLRRRQGQLRASHHLQVQPLRQRVATNPRAGPIPVHDAGGHEGVGDRSVTHARAHRELRTQGAAEDTSADRLRLQIGSDRAGSGHIGCNAMTPSSEAAPLLPQLSLYV